MSTITCHPLTVCAKDFKWLNTPWAEVTTKIQVYPNVFVCSVSMYTYLWSVWQTWEGWTPYWRKWPQRKSKMGCPLCAYLYCFQTRALALIHWNQAATNLKKLKKKKKKKEKKACGNIWRWAHIYTKQNCKLYIYIYRNAKHTKQHKMLVIIVISSNLALQAFFSHGTGSRVVKFFILFLYLSRWQT